MQRISQIGVRAGSVGPKVEGAPITCHGLLEAPQGEQRVAQVIVGFSQVRPQLEHAAVVAHRVLELS